MRSYKEITYRYLKGQRNRTLLTILGIILSVALVSAIGTIIVSARGALITEAIRENGSYHAKFAEMDKDNINKMTNHVGVSEVGVGKLEGAAIVKETTEEEKEEYRWDIPYRYIEIEGLEEEAIEMLPFNLKEGRIPKAPDEIAIEYWMASYFDKEVKLGDKIKLTMGNRIIGNDEETQDGQIVRKETFEKTGEKEYTVVGFIKPQYIWKGNLVTKGITGLDSRVEEGNYNAYIKIPNIKDAYEKITSIAKDLGKTEEDFEYNYRVLRLYAESMSQTFDRSMVVLLIFVVGLIIVSTIAVIYNAFNISVLERIAQFGLLRSVGATPNQIRGIVLKEALILSIIGIPIGLFSGVFAMRVVLYIISLLKSDIYLFKDMKITISGAVFLISTITGLVTVFLSAIGPARRAGKVSALEAVRNTGSFKKEKFKKIQNSILVRRILGVEGEIAYKNLRRNRKRFIITVFSMVISISLFITFSSFSDFMFKMGIVESKDMGDFSIYGDIDDKSEEIYTELRNIKDIKRVYKVKFNNGEALIEESRISKKMIEMAPFLFEKKRDNLIRINNVQVSTIGDENFETLKGLLKEGTLDVNRLNKENGVLIINSTYAYNQKTDRNSLMEGYKLKVGDKIPYTSYDLNKERVEPVYKELTVVGVLEKGILDKEYNPNGSINIITTESVLENLLKTDDEDFDDAEVGRYRTNMYIEMAENGSIESVKAYLDDLEEATPGLHYIDYAESAKENRVASIIVSIFLYGFVAIITLISSINIINTISTNIILRTKEIAMIKAVGMTQSGIKRMVALESLFYGIYAAIFGGVIGTGLSYILFNILMKIREFQWIIPWKNIAIACVGATIIALLSGAYPLKRINDKIIVESMKAEN
ncbi:ABC transporter permease [uncultured Tissierella sp.]|uniref:ABC transporter permease n=1 Tax=uncultured Tissierella sp. TaxID=448160 RepID=UPI00280468BB|nr:ABC transporter permease [uncultured Tissierella sp.]MDU5082507.1 ABC transporter permease [Bacillota bacterium]